MDDNTPHLVQKCLHEVFLNALGNRVSSYGDLDQKPLDVDLRNPLPPKIRLYIYNATHPPGGRTPGEHKIQLIVPGQMRGERGDFNHSDGRLVLLVGYEPELDVYILWDAGLYRQFSYSRNVQVKAETVYKAYASGIDVQKRSLRDVGEENVVAARGEKLSNAILLRTKLSLQRLVKGF